MFSTCMAGWGAGGGGGRALEHTGAGTHAEPQWAPLSEYGGECPLRGPLCEGLGLEGKPRDDFTISFSETEDWSPPGDCCGLPFLTEPW